MLPSGLAMRTVGSLCWNKQVMPRNHDPIIQLRPRRGRRENGREEAVGEERDWSREPCLVLHIQSF